MPLDNTKDYISNITANIYYETAMKLQQKSCSLLLLWISVYYLQILYFWKGTFYHSKSPRPAVVCPWGSWVQFLNPPTKNQFTTDLLHFGQSPMICSRGFSNLIWSNQTGKRHQSQVKLLKTFFLFLFLFFKLAEK